MEGAPIAVIAFSQTVPDVVEEVAAIRRNDSERRILCVSAGDRIVPAPNCSRRARVT